MILPWKMMKKRFISISMLLTFNVFVAKAFSKYFMTFKQSVSVYVNAPKGRLKYLLLKPPRRVFPFCHFFVSSNHGPQEITWQSRSQIHDAAKDMWTQVWGYYSPPTTTAWVITYNMPKMFVLRWDQWLDDDSGGENGSYDEN